MKLNFSLFALASLALQRCFSSGPMAANERSYRADPGMDASKSGEIYAANDGDIEAAWKSGNEYVAANDGNLSATPLGLSQPLSQFAAGVSDMENLQALLDRIAPPTPVGGIRFTYGIETESEEYQKRSLASITRPVHGEFAELKITGSEAEGRCSNIGLVSYIDLDQGGALPQMQQLEVQRLRNIILRSQIADALALIDSAASADTGMNWGASGADPDSDIDDMVDAGGRASGVDNNVVVFGRGSFMKRRRSYRKESRTNGGEHAILTPDQLRDVYQVDDVVNLRTVYRSSATANTALLDNTVYTYDARSGLSLKDSSNIKRMTYIGEGGATRVWIQIGSHRVKIIVDAYAVNKITRSVGIRKRAITYS
jgi:hypothetical protein